MQFYCITKKYMSWFLYFDIILKNDFLYQNSMLDILLFITIPKIVPSFYSFIYRDSRIYIHVTLSFYTIMQFEGNLYLYPCISKDRLKILTRLVGFETRWWVDDGGG